MSKRDLMLDFAILVSWQSDTLLRYCGRESISSGVCYLMNNLVSEIFYQLRYGLPLWFLSMITAWLPDMGPIIRMRGLLVSLFLPGRPKRLTLGRDVTLLCADRIFVGNDVYAAKGVWLNGIGGLTIQDQVVIGPYVVISSTNHGFRDGSVRFGGGHPAPIKIGTGTWLASHVVVAAGVIIGPGNLIAANSVVTKSTPPHSVIGGVPAKYLGVRRDNPSSILS